MTYRYIGLRIFNNLDWVITLKKLEKRGYLWVSKDKPTSLYQFCNRGTLYINPNEKIVAMSDSLTDRPKDCEYYIQVK